MLARCLGIEGKVNVFLLLGEAVELNVEGEGLEFDAFHNKSIVARFAPPARETCIIFRAFYFIVIIMPTSPKKIFLFSFDRVPPIRAA